MLELRVRVQLQVSTYPVSVLVHFGRCVSDAGVSACTAASRAATTFNANNAMVNVAMRANSALVDLTLRSRSMIGGTQ